MVNESEVTRIGHELKPLNDDDDHHQVTIVVSPKQNAENNNNNNNNNNAQSESKDETTWDGKLQFFLTIIGYSVGLGNIWRFPYLCSQHGGGAFLIPYFVMLIFEGIPLFLIELGLGQSMRHGALGVWNRIHPWLGGIGISACTVTFFVGLYYNVIITWCFFYFFNSLRAVWNIFYLNGSQSMNDAMPWMSCATQSKIEECNMTSSPTEYYWFRETLDASPSIEDPQGLKWWIVLCLLLSWSVVFGIMMKGIRSSGKILYFTSLFPYAVLTIFFFRGVTLSGAKHGLSFMFTPNVAKLSDPVVWLDAATQVFYSFGLAFGSLIAFGSYNSPKNNCIRDVITVSICNIFTAIYASIVVFAILGFKAQKNYEKCLINSGTLGNCSIKIKGDEGTGLAFIVFTQAMLELPGAPFWSCIFFLMLLALGLGSQIGLLEGMLCVVFDIEYVKRFKKQYVTGILCIVCFFIGLIFCTGAGGYWLQLFDKFASTIGLSIIALLEMVAVSYVYGHERFSKDIENMTGYKPNFYWQITWRFISPALIVVLLISSVVFMIINKPVYSAWDATQGKSVDLLYPTWTLVISVAIVFIGIAPIIIVYLVRRFQYNKYDVNIHQGSIRRIDTTTSTKEMIDDADDDYNHKLEDFPEEDEYNSSDDDQSQMKIRTIQHEKIMKY